VDIGTTNNGTSNLSRQIQYGLSASDLAPYGGQLSFNQGLQLDGNPGLSAAIKAPLTAIIGQPLSPRPLTNRSRARILRMRLDFRRSPLIRIVSHRPRRDEARHATARLGEGGGS
jgi:hypothetical protein